MKKFVTILCLFSIITVEGQIHLGIADEYEIQEKYWYYRWRLRNDFLYMGSEPGESLPIPVRNVFGEGNFRTGDVTQLLGYYISTLATEHKLLAQTNRTIDMTMTRTEMYYTYKAFERLDYNAEPFFPHVNDDPTTVSPHDNAPVQLKIIQQNYYAPALDGFFY
jgi:hypothetical protein